MLIMAYIIFRAIYQQKKKMKGGKIEIQSGLEKSSM